jgi:uncharacterized membrane protein YoaT (DUF817 family)
LKAKLVRFAFSKTPLKATKGVRGLKLMYAVFVEEHHIAYGIYDGQYVARKTSLIGNTFVVGEVEAREEDIRLALEFISVGCRIARQKPKVIENLKGYIGQRLGSNQANAWYNIVTA